MNRKKSKKINKALRDQGIYKEMPYYKEYQLNKFRLHSDYRAAKRELIGKK